MINRAIQKLIIVAGIAVFVVIGIISAGVAAPASDVCTKGDLLGDQVLMDNHVIDGTIPDGVIDSIPPEGVFVEVEVLRTNCRNGNSHKAIVIPEGAETPVFLATASMDRIGVSGAYFVNKRRGSW